MKRTNFFKILFISFIVYFLINTSVNWVANNLGNAPETPASQELQLEQQTESAQAR